MWAILAVFAAAISRAESPPGEGFPVSSDAVESSGLVEPAPQASTAPRTSKKQKRGASVRERETEGTQAPNRFEANPIIKSQYQLDGQPLEVDPD